MDPSQYPSLADWSETKHKSWGTTVVALHTNIVELFTTLRIKQVQREVCQEQFANHFQWQIYAVCRKIQKE